ncbi:MAG: hypothetical protein Kow0077_18980 [Anaerolineae bacterium]
MARIFEWQFKVRSYELDSAGRVPTAVVHNYLEEAATRASTDAGFSYDWYFRNRRAWVVRQMTARYDDALRYGDEVRVRTWVSDFKRSYSHREYEVWRVRDNALVARARAKWVYVNLETLRPERIPAAAEAAFDPSGELAPIALWGDGHEGSGALVVSGDRRVLHDELDPAGHVNNAVYVRWFEQAVRDGFTALGWDWSQLQREELEILPRGHRIEYFAPATEGYRLHVNASLIRVDANRSAWHVRVANTQAEAMIAEDYCVIDLVDARTGQAHVPPQLLQALQDTAERRS